MSTSSRFNLKFLAHSQKKVTQESFILVFFIKKASMVIYAEGS